MQVSGNNLSLVSRSAVFTPGASRVTNRSQLDPVDPSDRIKDLTSSEYRELQDLKQRDREVRQHEQAHIAAGGGHVHGGASFSYETGPDGRRYATGGEVQIDTAEVSGDPAATISKMQAIRSAATAPAQPSAQDRTVAAEAARTEAQARMELREEQQADDEQPQSPRAREALASYRTIDASGHDAASLAPRLDLTA